MPLELIIYGLRESVSRHPADHELRDIVVDAVEALQKMDEKLEEAYQEGKQTMAEEIIASLKGGLK